MGKLSKFVLFSAAAGAAAYGAYYYLKKEQVISPVVEVDDDIYYDEDLDAEPTKARSYVNLNFDKEKAEDLAKNAVKKAKETINDSLQKVENYLNGEKSVDIVSDVEEAAEDIAEEIADAADEIKEDAEATLEEKAEDIKEAVQEATDVVTEEFLS